MRHRRETSERGTRRRGVGAVEVSGRVVLVMGLRDEVVLW
jgi:hypothetical protein